MRDRPQSGSRQGTQCANSDKYRWEFRCPGITIAQSIVVALVLVQLGLSQTLFDVRNPKNQKWPEAEANRIYIHRIFICTQYQCEVRVNRLRQFEFGCYSAGRRHIDTIGFSFRPLLVFRIAHIKEGLGKTELRQH